MLPVSCDRMEKGARGRFGAVKMSPFSATFRCSLIIFLCRNVAGDLNFYMNETETRRLLGKYLNYGS